MFPTSVSFGTTLCTVQPHNPVVIPAETVFIISEWNCDGYRGHGIFRALQEVREEDYTEWQQTQVRVWRWTEALITQMIKDGVLEYLGNLQVAIQPFHDKMTWAFVSDPDNAEWKSDVDAAQ